jgi:hypothetical protein
MLYSTQCTRLKDTTATHLAEKSRPIQMRARVQTVGMEANTTPPESMTPRDRDTPSPPSRISARPKRPYNAAYTSPLHTPTPPQNKVTWFHGGIGRKSGAEGAGPAAALLSKKQLAEAEWVR